MPKRDKHNQRLAAIFGTPDVPDVHTETLERYLAYLKQQVTFPCQMTGIEPFDWEASYVLEPRSQWEHARLRQTRPSSMDIYELLDFDDEVDPDSGIFVNVQRVSDTKPFVLPLADLQATKKTSNNAQLLDDFSVWFVNGR
jgi:hypothetical protein